MENILKYTVHCINGANTDYAVHCRNLERAVLRVCNKTINFDKTPVTGFTVICPIETNISFIFYNGETVT